MWRQAWQMAINVDNPQRALLYDIYTDNLIDLHLQGCISQRVGMVKRNKYRLVGKTAKKTKRPPTCSARNGSTTIVRTSSFLVIGDTRLYSSAMWSRLPTA